MLFYYFQWNIEPLCLLLAEYSQLHKSINLAQKSGIPINSNVGNLYQFQHKIKYMWIHSLRFKFSLDSESDYFESSCICTLPFCGEMGIFCAECAILRNIKEVICNVSTLIEILFTSLHNWGGWFQIALWYKGVLKAVVIKHSLQYPAALNGMGNVTDTIN